MFTFDRFENSRDHQCQQNFSSEKRILIFSSFRKFVRTQFAKFHWKAMVRLLFYRNVARDHFSLFVKHLYENYQAPSIVMLSFFFRGKRYFPFSIVSFVLIKSEQHLLDLIL